MATRKPWNDSARGDSESSKWFSEIVLYKELGRDFFRPKSLEFDARPYSYNSLTKVRKVGANWELEIKGADEPNRAIVLLDSDLKLIRATKSTDTGR